MAEAERRADVVWEGTLAEGSGVVTFASGALPSVPVTWTSRTARSEGKTSPEELVAGAHASCFCMALSHTLAENGTPPQRLEASATVTFAEADGGWKVASSRLDGEGHRAGHRRRRLPRSGGGGQGRLPHLRRPQGQRRGERPGRAGLTSRRAKAGEGCTLPRLCSSSPGPATCIIVGMREAACQGRRALPYGDAGRGACRPRSLAASLLVAIALAAGLCFAGPAAADTPASPFVLDPQRSLGEQYGYAPSYTRHVPVFDGDDHAYIRSRTSSGDSTSYVHTLQNGAWQRLDFAGALRAAYPTMTHTLGAGGLRNDSIVFDRQGRAYNPLTIRLTGGKIRNVLMVSWDRCRTWSVYELPDGQFAVERWVGHNQIDGPPFMALWRPSTVNPAPRAKRYSLWVTKPQLDGDRLVLPPLAHVTDQCLGLGKDSGGSSFAVTYGGATTFAWSEATPPGTQATPQFVATYDHASGAVSPKQLLSAARPANDIHNKPGICIDSQGYLHFVSGTHGAPVMYRRSLAPYTIAAGWTAEEPVLSDGYTAAADGTGEQRARQTYDAFVCDSKDVLHLVTRQFRRGVDAYFGGAVYGALIHQSRPSGGTWGPATLIVVPAEAGYAVFFHKLALDHRDRLFLSCSSSGGTRRTLGKARGAMLSVLGRAAPRLGKYQRRMLLVSDDGGSSWRLAGDTDLAAPGEPPAVSPAATRPAHAITALSPAPWTWLRPRPVGNQLTAMDLTGGRSGWAVGTHGTILHTVDGGLHWTQQDAGIITDLFGVAAMDKTTALVVGQDGLILRTRDGGVTWHRQVSGSTDTLFAVAARSRRLAWVVGDRGTALHTRDGGRTWARQRSLTRETLYGVTFVSDQRGWACGGDGRIRMTWDAGRRWQSQRSATHKMLFGIAFADPSRGVAVGDSGTMMRTTDGGHTWRVRDASVSADLRAVRMTAAGRAYATGAGGTFVRSGDAGRTWTRRRLPLGGMCGALETAANGRVWVGGEGGSPCRSRDTGRSWSRIPPGVSVSLRAVAVDSEGLWVAGVGGLVLRSDAAALHWTVAALPKPVTLTSLAVTGPETWIAGRRGSVFHRYGAAAWSQVDVSSGRDLADVAALGEGRAWVAGREGSLLSTDDGGLSWRAHPATSSDLTCLAFSDDLHGWAGGGAAEGEDHAIVLRTQDGGVSWQEMDAPIWGRLLDMQFIDDDRGWAVAEDWGQDGDIRAGAVLATDDGGLTWRVQARSESVLTVVHMTDGSRGWAFGEEGAALRTEDGGLTWEQQDVGTDATLRAAVRLGSGELLIAGDGGVMLVTPAPAGD